MTTRFMPTTRTLLLAVVAALATSLSHAELNSNQPDGSGYAAMPLTSLQAAAQTGEKSAQFYLANRYKQGQGVAQDLTQAFNWYLKAAQNGAAAAMLNVGQMYAEGRGTAQNLPQAKLWLQKAAQLGDNRASYNLALLEERSQNLTDAYQWYDVSARDGMLSEQVKGLAQGKIRKLAANLSIQDIQDARSRADRWLQTSPANR